jgi:2-hydroxychromene-2-carboxylate isomerase
MKTVDFYWDAGSTNTYFALKLIDPIVERHGAQLVLHPFNLGHVFRHHDYVLADEPPAKLRNRRRDLERWAERYRLPFHMPSTFPIKTSRVLRASIAARSVGLERQFVDAVMSRYWEHNDASIAEYSGLARVAAGLGMNGETLVRMADSEEVRAALAASTEGALARGGFGAPTLGVDGELYWGKDRMEFVADALASG